MSFSQKNHLLSLESSLGKDYLILTEFEGNEGISKLFAYSLETFSSDQDISPATLLGKSVTFSIKNFKGEGRVFNGIVNRFGKGSLNFNGTRNYSFEVVPWIWLLTLTSNCQIFQNKTTPQILEQVFQGAGFRNYDISKLSKSYTPREYCVQYDETSFDFISRLMEEEGIFYYFLHQDGSHTLVLGDSQSSYYSLPGNTLRFSDSTTPATFIYGWQHEYNFCSGRFSQSDYNFKMPNKNLLTTTNTVLNFPDFTKYEFFEYPGCYDDIPPGKERAQVRIEETETQHERINGEGDYCHFSSGGTFTIQGRETSSQQEKYVILSLYHKAIDKTHIARDETLPSYKNRFTCFSSQMNFHPQRTTKKPFIPGAQTAVVVGPENEEIYTDKYGRIKVQFFWDRKGAKDEKSSCWIRVSQSIAGNHWGAIYIPRIGQEVIVTFLNGDIDSPLITGCVYNAGQMPPYELPKCQTKMGVKTHSTKGGTEKDANELMFEDKKGFEEVYLHAQKDFKEVIENDSSSKIGHDAFLEVKNNFKATVKEGNENYVIEKGNRTINIEKGNYQLEVKTGNYTLVVEQGNQSTKVNLGKSSLEAMQSIELSVGQNSIKIDQTGVTIQALMVKINGTMVQMEANAMLQLKGSLTMIN